MSKYKVGGVAALFSTPKEPTTEAGKKLQSLFKEFHNKKNKFNSQSNQVFTVKKESDVEKDTKGIEKQRVPKNKKRKFSVISNPESNFEDTKSKKFNKKTVQEDSNSGKCTEKEKEYFAEQDFPRKKKSKTNTNNNDFNKFVKGETAFSDIEDEFDVSYKSKNKKKDKKQHPGFIKKSKQQKLPTANDGIESQGSNKLTDEEDSDNDTLFKGEIEEFIKKSAKKLKKEKYNDSFGQNLQGNHIDSSAHIESPDNEKLKKMSNEQSLISDTSFKNEDFVRKSKGKSNSDNFIRLSQPKFLEKGEPGFIKLSSKKYEDEETLSRTLFIGNLPVNTTKKALRSLFSSFGEVEDIRYHGIETDKAKIFSEDGCKSLNPNNYAADSVPGFIIYKDRQSAVNALSLSGSLFKDHHITVDFALPAGTKKLYDDKRSIFIGNLPFDIKDESVWEAFSECGRIENVRVVRDKKTGIGKGFGYVQFSTIQSKDDALVLEDLKIHGRPIRIKAVESKKTQSRNNNNNAPSIKRDTFKSKAIKLKKKNKDSGSRKSVKKIMKKQKNLHQKKKIANILQKSMKS